MSHVFVSYSRKDRDAIAAIVSALRAADQEVWVDLEDIAPSAVWMEEIKTAITNADSVIFVISPDSVTSQVCGLELKHAVDLSKRVVPVVIRDTPVAAVPAPLRDIDWSFVRPETFDADVARLVDILETDIARVHLHTRLLARATEWETRGGDKSMLLRGAQLAEADRWLAGQTDQKPTTTPVQGQFMAASRRAVSRRQRGSIVGAVAVIAIMAVIATVAVFQWHNATVQRNQAQTRFRQAVSLRLVSEAHDMLARSQPGGDARAFQQLLASRPLTQTPDDGALYSAVVKKVTTAKIVDTPASTTSVAFSPDGHRFAAASADHTVRLWDADTGHLIGDPLTGHTDTVFKVAFSPDRHRLASASDDDTVRLWDADTGQPVGAPLTGHTGAVERVAFSPDGHRLASASADDTVRLWDADTGQPIGAPLTGHTDAVHSVAFSPDGHRLASASDDDTVRLWDADTGQPIGAPLTGHTDAVHSVAF